MVKKTRKAKSRSQKAKAKASKVLTIPDLRRGMEHISDMSKHLMTSSKASFDEKVAAFQKEWRAVFGKSIDTKVAADYLKHIASMNPHPFKHHTRKHGRKGHGKKMKGGQAPVDYITRPGENVPYGVYPDYISKGFWNPEPGILQSCGVQQGVMPYAETGSNKFGQAGGSLLGDMLSAYIPGSTAAAALSFRPYTAENPATMQQNLGTTWKGQSTGPGAESWQQAWQPRYTNPTAGPPVAMALDRTLANDIRKV